MGVQRKLATFVALQQRLVRGADENTFFWRVFARFLSCFLLFHGQFVYEMPFLQKKSSHLTFSSRRSASYKVPPRIGGHHFLLCQQTNTKDIAGQSARVPHSPPPRTVGSQKPNGKKLTERGVPPPSTESFRAGGF